MPRILDLFCKAGGAGAGYSLAGFDVLGVDIEPQPRYPFGFVQGDALAYLKAHGHEFDAVHASPPCLAFTRAGKIREGHKEGRRAHPDLIGPTRELLAKLGKPWIIENVEGAPMAGAFMLCGTMFPGLRVLRHRLFEASFPVEVPAHQPHPRGRLIPPRGEYDRGQGRFVCVVGNNFSPGVASEAMGGIAWMNRAEMAQAIPPVYTRLIGLNLQRFLDARQAAA